VSILAGDVDDDVDGGKGIKKITRR